MPHRIGVCYYKDFQDFIKRFRINLKRDYGFELPIKFFGCSEYGEKSKRPHFHFLLFAPSGFDEELRLSVIKSWPYGRHIRNEKSFQLVSDDPASYVASYVNCGFKFSSFLARNFKPKSSFSKFFGHGKDVFRLSEIQKAIRKGDLQYVVESAGSISDEKSCLPYPKYVINRWFPLFKGYSRLASNTVFDFISSYFSKGILWNAGLRFDDLNPDKKIVYTDDDLDRICSHFRYVFASYQDETGIKDVNTALLCYAHEYLQAWTCYKSTIKRLWYLDDTVSVAYKYDNLCLLRPNVRNYILSDYLNLGDDTVVFLDPNEFPDRVNSTNKLVALYDTYCKDKEISNIVMNDNGVFV